MISKRLNQVHHEPLPSAWIDRIFAKLTARFGREFLSRWEGVEIDVVKGDWADELAGMQNRPDAIKYALDNMGNKPPMVDDFKAMCSRAPDDGLIRLSAPKANPDAIERAIRVAREALLQRQGDPLDILRELAESDAHDGTFRGQRVTLAQRQTYQQALGLTNKDRSS